MRPADRKTCTSPKTISHSNTANTENLFYGCFTIFVIYYVSDNIILCLIAHLTDSNNPNKLNICHCAFRIWWMESVRRMGVTVKMLHMVAWAWWGLKHAPLGAASERFRDARSPPLTSSQKWTGQRLSGVIFVPLATSLRPQAWLTSLSAFLALFFFTLLFLARADPIGVFIVYPSISFFFHISEQITDRGNGRFFQTPQFPSFPSKKYEIHEIQFIKKITHRLPPPFLVTNYWEYPKLNYSWKQTTERH